MITDVVVSRLGMERKILNLMALPDINNHKRVNSY